MNATNETNKTGQTTLVWPILRSTAQWIIPANHLPRVMSVQFMTRSSRPNIVKCIVLFGGHYRLQWRSNRWRHCFHEAFIFTRLSIYSIKWHWCNATCVESDSRAQCTESNWLSQLLILSQYTEDGLIKTAHFMRYHIFAAIHHR